MNLKLKAAVAAIALTAGGAAFADPIPVEGLFLSARDTVNNTSIVINLNLTTTAFRADSTSSRSLSGDGLADLTSWLSTANLSGVLWNVAGASNDGSYPAGDPSPLWGGLTTATTDITANPFPDWGLSGNLETTQTNFTIFRSVVNPNLTASDGYSTTGIGALFFVNKDGGVGIMSEAELGQSVNFYSFFAGQEGDPYSVGDSSAFGGAWALSFAAGIASLTYASASAPPVPVPAAVWLFASGIAGLMGVSRRKKAA